MQPTDFAEEAFLLLSCAGALIREPIIVIQNSPVDNNRDKLRRFRASCPKDAALPETPKGLVINAEPLAQHGLRVLAEHGRRRVVALPRL